MRKTTYFAVAALLTVAALHAQKHAASFTVGALAGSKQSPSVGNSVAISGSYAYRFFGRQSVALAVEGSVIAGPLQIVSSLDRNATRDFASLYVLPALRFEIRPRDRFTPFFAAGGGYALFEQSLYRLDGGANPAPRFRHTGALAFGGGVDVRLWRSFAARWELRDLYSGNPSLNTAVNGRGFHNVYVAGGLVLRFGRGEG